MMRWVAGALFVMAVVLALRALGPGRAGAVQATPAPGVSQAADAAPDVGLDSLYRAWSDAEARAWREANEGSSVAIAAATAERTAAAGRLLARLEHWAYSGEALEPEFTSTIEAAFLARRTGRRDLSARALARLVTLLPEAHSSWSLVQLANGMTAREKMDLPSALRSFESAAASPAFLSRDVALLELSEVRTELGDTVHAIEPVRMVLAIEPPSARLDQAKAFLAAEALRNGRYEEASGYAAGLPGAGTKGETKAGQMLLLARIARARKETRLARQQYYVLFQEFPSLPLTRSAWEEFTDWRRRTGGGISAEEKLAGAQVLLRNGREDGGVALIRQIVADTVATSLKIDATDKEALHYYGRRRYADAREAWGRMDRLAARQPGRRADARIGVARTWRNAGQVEEMTRAYEDIAADTTLPVPAAKATWELAREYKSLGRFADCEAVLTRYLERYPLGEDAGPARLMRGLCRILLGRSAEAEEDFREMARRSERRSDKEAAGYWRARARLESDNATGAVETLRAALAYDMPDGYYGYRIRELLDRLAPGDSVASWYPDPTYSAVRDPFRPAVIEAMTGRPRAHYERGLNLARAGFPEEAQLDLGRAVDLLPEDGVFQEIVAALANRLGLYSFSMTTARRALSRADSKVAEARLWRYVYSLGYYDLIGPASAANGLDPMLVAGLIRQESLFDPRALSRAGARGLMQLMLPTAQKVAAQRGEAAPDAEDLYQPALSVAYGTHYLRDKLAEFDNYPEVALAAYNAGERKAKEWQDLVTRGLAIPERRNELESRFDPDLFMELIDYSETKDYVRRVRYNQETFRLFYGARPGLETGDPGPGGE